MKIWNLAKQKTKEFFFYTNFLVHLINLTVTCFRNKIRTLRNTLNNTYLGLIAHAQKKRTVVEV